jgi:hypothetical protein
MMDNPILRGYTKKVQPVIVNDKLHNSVILIASIILCGIILLLCVDRVWAVEIDLNIIAQIESSNNPMAYNSRTQAVGLYQITPICLADFNEYSCSGSCIPGWDMDLMYQKWYAEYVARWYFEKRIPQLLKHYHKPVTLENIITAYNAGIKAVVKGYCPRETRNYIAKYKRLKKAIL